MQLEKIKESVIKKKEITDEDAYQLYLRYNDMQSTPISLSSFIQQLERELDMSSYSINRKLYSFSNMMSKNMFSDTQIGNFFIKQLMGEMIKEVKDLFITAQKSFLKVNRATDIVNLISMSEPILKNPEKIAVIALKICFDSILHARPRPVISVARDISNLIIHELQYDKAAEADSKLIKILKRTLKSKFNYAKKQETMSGFFRDKEHIPKLEMSPKLKLEFGNNLIRLVIKVTEGHIRQENINLCIKGSYKTQACVLPTRELVNKMERSLFNILFSSLQYQPMLIPPIPWHIENNKMTGGYISASTRPLQFCKTRSEEQKKLIDKGDFPVVVSSINKIQSTPWKINTTILNLLKKLNEKNPVWLSKIGIPSSKPEPQPVKPPHLDIDVEMKKKYRRAKNQWHIDEIEMISQRANYKLVIDIAQANKKKRFYMPWQTDSRGRIYPVGYLHCQGPDFVKTLLLFDEAKPVTKKNDYWLKLHLANLIATDPWSDENIDKQHIDSRVNWVNDHQSKLLDIAHNYESNLTWIDFDKPLTGLAALLDFAAYIKHGEGYKSHLWCTIDASCSGLQILASLMRCEDTAKLVNLIDNPKPFDIYTLIFEKTVTELEKICDGRSFKDNQTYALELAKKAYTNASGTSWSSCLNSISTYGKESDKASQVAKKTYINQMEAYAWLDFGIDRKTVKRPVMTYNYSATEYGFKEQIMEDTLTPVYKKLMRSSPLFYTYGFEQRKEMGFPFQGSGHKAAVLLGSLIYNSVESSVRLPSQAMRWLVECTKIITKENRHMSWKTALNFPVVQNYMHSKEKRVTLNFVGRGYTCKLTDMEYQDDKIDSRREVNGIAPNMVHSLDATQLMKTIDLAASRGISAFALSHDAYGTHVADMETMSRSVREATVDLFKNYGMEELHKQFIALMPADKRDRIPSCPQKGAFDLNSILKAKHAFS